MKFIVVKLRARGERRHWKVVSALALLVLFVAACGSSGSQTAASSTSSGTASLKGKHIVFIAGDQGDPFYITLYCGALSEAKKYGISLSMEAPQQFDPSQQTPLVNAVVAAHPSALLIAPTNDVAMYTPIKEAADAGIKVGFVDTTLKNPSMALFQVTTDDTAGGEIAAQALAKLVPAGGQVAIVNLTPGVSTTDERAAGFESEAKKVGLRVVAQVYAGNSTAQAESLVGGLIAKYPHLAGLFTTTDFGAEGSVTALRGAKLLKKVKIVGFDASPIMIKELKAGYVQAISAQQARQIGVDALQQMVRAFRGEPTVKRIALPTVTVTQGNLGSAASQAVIQKTSC